MAIGDVATQSFIVSDNEEEEAEKEKGSSGSEDGGGGDGAGRAAPADGQHGSGRKGGRSPKKRRTREEREAKVQAAMPIQCNADRFQTFARCVLCACGVGTYLLYVCVSRCLGVCVCVCSAVQTGMDASVCSVMLDASLLLTVSTIRNAESW